MSASFTPQDRQLVGWDEQRESQHKQPQLPGLRYRFIPAYDALSPCTLCLAP